MIPDSQTFPVVDIHFQSGGRLRVPEKCNVDIEGDCVGNPSSSHCETRAGMVSGAKPFRPYLKLGLIPG